MCQEETQNWERGRQRTSRSGGRLVAPIVGADTESVEATPTPTWTQVLTPAEVPATTVRQLMADLRLSLQLRAQRRAMAIRDGPFRRSRMLSAEEH